MHRHLSGWSRPDYSSKRSVPRGGRSRRRPVGERGQAALVLVVGFTVMLTIVGGVMVTSIVNNAPILKQASIQRYAYRAMISGLDTYQNDINANPYLAACNYSQNYTASPLSGSPQCGGINYQTWSEVAGTNTGNGVIPEYYKFDNPQQIIDPTTKAVTYLEVQVVGAAGFPGKDVYYSTVAKFTPQNGFLNNIWWSNYESFNDGTFTSARVNHHTTYTYTPGSASSCDYFYHQGRNVDPNTNLVGRTPCVAVNFAPGDALYGPVYSNDSLFIYGNPSFTGTVNTADPLCQFVDFVDFRTPAVTPSTGCNSLDAGNYTTTGSSYGNAVATAPTTNGALQAYAQQGGCYYQGPTTVTITGSTMTVVSRDTTGYPGTDTMNTNSTDSSVCPTDGSGTLPANGVLYVDSATVGHPGANPFDGSGSTSQIQANCPGCYYGQSSTPDTEADAFVSGSLSGHLTVGAANDVVIDGPISYSDCSWATPSRPSQSICGYNSAAGSTPNDTLGLIANNYVEVDHPVDNTSIGVDPDLNNQIDYATTLPACSSTNKTQPLCDPSTATGSPSGGQGLTIDATILSLNQSFVVNNYQSMNVDGQLTIYGSIQQNARGPVGVRDDNGIVRGYIKYYLWDPRLTLYGPPYYLAPGTTAASASWALDSSAESYTGTEPSCPPVQPTPTQADGTSSYPYPGWPVSGSTAAGTGNCTPAS